LTSTTSDKDYASPAVSFNAFMPTLGEKQSVEYASNRTKMAYRDAHTERLGGAGPC
jgi:hypothetical protein